MCFLFAALVEYERPIILVINPLMSSLCSPLLISVISLFLNYMHRAEVSVVPK